MNLKISLIGAIPPPVGGISTYVKQLAEKLAEKNVNVEIIDITGVKKELKNQGVSLIVVKSWHTKEFFTALLKSQAKIFHAHIATYRVDHFLLINALIGRLRKKPFVITNHGGGFVKFMERPIYRKVFRIIALNLADGIIAIDEKKYEKTLEVIPPQKRWKVSFLPLPVDTEKFNPKVDGTIVRKKYNIKDNQNLVIFGPHLEEIYAPDQFIKAASIVSRKKPNTVFILLGSGTLRKELEKMVKQMNLESNTIFCGVVPFNRIETYYAACDVYCNPCILGQGISTLEAMACGKPVVGTKTKTQIRIRDKMDGLLFKSEDIEDFAEKIIWLLEHPDERKIMGTNGRRKIEKFHCSEENAQKHIDFYNRILGH